MRRNILNCIISVLIMVLFWSMMCVGVVCKSKDKPDAYVEEKPKNTTTVFELEEQEQEQRPTYETFLATAYCSCEKCCGVWATKRPVDKNGEEIVYTASGSVAKQGRTVAADPTEYPYGTTIVFGGVEYVVEDCGGAIKGSKRIDVYFNNHEDALSFGKKTVVAVVEMGEQN